MAVSQNAKEFYEYALKQVEKGENAEISAKDKLTSKWVLNKYKTWGEVYNAAYKEYVAQGGKPAVQKTGEGTVGPSRNTYQAQKTIDPLSLYTDDKGVQNTLEGNIGVSFDPESGEMTLQDKNGQEHFLYVQSDGTVRVSPDWDSIRNKVISDYQSKQGGIEKLFSLLRSKQLITEEAYKNKDVSSNEFNRALVDVIRKYGVSSVDKRSLNKEYSLSGFDSFIAGDSIGGSGGPKTSVSLQRHETLRVDADKEINAFFIENVGRAATKEEKETYFNTLHAAEKKAVVKSTTTSGDGSVSGLTTGSLIGDTDKLMMQGKIAGNAIAGSNLDTIIKSGAKVAQDISTLKTYAKRQGITLSDEQAMGYVADNLRTGKDIKSNQAKLQKLAKIKYSNLANSIDDDTTVEDIASEAMYTVSRLTGIPYKSLSVNSGIIQKVLANNGKPGVMPDYEVAKLVKTDPETKQAWLNSPTAREEAAGYATNILKSFGLI